MVIALESAEIILILKAMSDEKGIMLNTRATIKNKGAPGGCGTAIVLLQAINSPQSQNETVGAIVAK